MKDLINHVIYINNLGKFLCKISRHIFITILIYNRLKADLQDKADDCLIDPMGECTQSLLNLMIFGSATPYLHNGTLVLGDVEDGKGVSSYR